MVEQDSEGAPTIYLLSSETKQAIRNHIQIRQRKHLSLLLRNMFKFQA